MNNFYKIFFIAYVFCFFANADADLEKQISDMRAEIDSLAEAIEEGTGEAGWWTRTSIGGYGELHWEMAHKSNDDNTNAKVVDAHRYVFFYRT